MSAPLPAELRRYVMLVIVMVALAAAGGVAGLLWLAPSSGGDKAAPVAHAGPDVCGIQVRANFDTDADMRRMAVAVGADKRVAAIATGTKQQAYERFQHEFRDMPNLLALGRPEALPATVWIAPVAGVDPDGLSGEFQTRFPTAKDVQVLRCGYRDPAVPIPTF